MGDVARLKPLVFTDKVRLEHQSAIRDIIGKLVDQADDRQLREMLKWAHREWCEPPITRGR